MNRLADETSPYLRQHADNPVHWLPWGTEALARARAEDRPIFLSVGYSSCHWCHVMAHESFEDPATAAVMNGLFVNVKVDREERPDLDALYMEAVQLLTGRGGWPMSVWLTPRGEPFYAGTYFPREARAGMPSFVAVCEAVGTAWANRRHQVVEQAGELTSAIGRRMVPPVAAGSEPDADLLDRARAALTASFDPEWGGFGQAPKFPPAMSLVFLAEEHVRTGDPVALDVVRVTLDAMADGGIHDHLGGGFARYSTDRQWLVPHFEKMLYDNALLLRAYTAAWQLTGSGRYRRVVEGIAGYLTRDLSDPGGGFYAAQDADSEGAEGRFYVWSPEELAEVCGRDADAVADYFGVTPEGNFEGRSVLHVATRGAEPPSAVTRNLGALLRRRDTRPRPGLDDKIVLAWNGLAVRGLVEAGAALGRPDWIARGADASRFLLGALRRPDGRLWRSRTPGRPGASHGQPAFAEDHAALLAALLTLAEHDDTAWLDDAAAVAEDLIRLFRDRASGAFFTTGSDAEPLVVRAKDFIDGATPSANSLAAESLLRLAALTGDDRYRDCAEEVFSATAGLAAKHPGAFAHLLVALARRAVPPLEVVVSGDPERPLTEALRRRLGRRLLPGAVVALASPRANETRSPLLVGRVAPGAAAYVCLDHACAAPTSSPDGLDRLLDDALEQRRASRSRGAGGAAQESAP